MRVTSSMYYESLYGANNSKLSKKLFDVNKQIASGLKIQYAKDDVRTFAETMKLDNELSTIGQIKKSTESGYKIANQTDVVLNEFETTMNRMRTLLLQAANGTNDNTSLDSVAQELRVIESHLKNLSNTSINGQYLFSGTAVDIKPISADGTYNGNSGSLNSFLGSNAQQRYNISGADLFLGEEILTKRTITSNVVNTNLISQYSALQAPGDAKANAILSPENTIRDLMGDTDAASVPANDHYFYISGTKSNGESFKQKTVMQDDQKIDELLTKIGNAFGNTPNLNVVNVTLNASGQIVVEDKIKGSSKLDFHMVGAVDFGGTGLADVTDINDLDSGENNFNKIMTAASTAVNPNLHVKEFIKSGYTSAANTATNIEGIVYDRTNFEKNGSKLSSNTPQIVKGNNAFAQDSTKLSQVADVSQLPNIGSLAGTTFKLTGTNVAGVAFDVQIDLKNTLGGGSTFSLDGGVTNYEIFNMDTPRSAVNADDMTYKQFMDVINIVTTGNLPANAFPAGTAGEYDTAIASSDLVGRTFLSHDGKIQFQETAVTDTKATIAIHDVNSGDFAAAAPVMTFNSNNGVTIRDPKTDFFKSINAMITAVEDHKLYPDSGSGVLRNIGIENAIAMMDDLQDHIFRAHSLVGSQSNALTLSKERVELLEISTKTLRSSVIDTDQVEAALILKQLTLNQEAMFSTIAKVSKLSLVNYL